MQRMPSVPAPEHETRDLLLGAVLGMVLMVAIVLGTLYAFGYFARLPAVDDGGTGGRIVVTSEDLTPAPRPTAVWKFREEWRTPRGG